MRSTFVWASAALIEIAVRKSDAMAAPINWIRVIGKLDYFFLMITSQSSFSSEGGWPMEEVAPDLSAWTLPSWSGPAARGLNHWIAQSPLPSARLMSHVPPVG